MNLVICDEYLGRFGGFCSCDLGSRFKLAGLAEMQTLGWVRVQSCLAHALSFFMPRSLAVAF